MISLLLLLLLLLLFVLSSTSLPLLPVNTCGELTENLILVRKDIAPDLIMSIILPRRTQILVPGRAEEWFPDPLTYAICLPKGYPSMDIDKWPMRAKIGENVLDFTSGDSCKVCVTTNTDDWLLDDDECVTLQDIM